MKLSPYSKIEIKDGYVEFNMKSWDDFTNYLNKHFLRYSRSYIWRGQEDSMWLLESALDRLLKKYNRKNKKFSREKHLENFKYSIRGRGDFSLSNLSDDDYWALGQHYGLATPLLDWTKSPFIAAFFAICNMPYKYPNIYSCNLEQNSFSIFALHKSSIEKKSKSNSVRIIEPLVDSNPRLVSQGGLFTMIEVLTDIETWVKDNFKGEEDLEVLIKFVIPYKDMKNTKNILSILDRMNINHLSLFPDLYGSSAYCNLKIGVPNY